MSLIGEVQGTTTMACRLAHGTEITTTGRITTAPNILARDGGLTGATTLC